MTDRKEKDLELYQTWRQTGSKKDLANVMKQMEPLIYKQVKRVSGSVPPSAISSEAKRWTLRALDTYDPNQNTALSTHVHNWLQKTHRLNYKYQNAVRLPEDQTRKFQDYNVALTNLQTQLNRDPDDDEIASHLGWQRKDVSRMRERLHSDLYESGTEVPTTYTKFDNTQILKSLVEENLDPQEQKIWENVQKSKEERKSVPELANEMNIDVNRLQYIKSRMVKKIKRLQDEMGTWS